VGNETDRREKDTLRMGKRRKEEERGKMWEKTAERRKSIPARPHIHTFQVTFHT
jgi:hypothetical protein